MKLKLIVATDRNGVIGVGNEMPWHLPNDFKYFKEQTGEGIVIMGRKTFESIGRPLPNRINIIISRDPKDGVENIDEKTKVMYFRTLEDAIDTLQLTAQLADEILEENNMVAGVPKEAWIIGGGQIYEEAARLPKDKMVEELYITEVDVELPESEENVYFKFDPDLWEETSRIFNTKDEKHDYDYNFVVYKRLLYCIGI